MLIGAYYAIQLNISDLDYDTIKSFNHHLATLLHQGVFEPLLRHWHVKTPKLSPSQYPSLNIPF
ncbi:protein of unknown function [Shewanella benthica]|uniref:Uncharacterized protein n=1 Tax=Shewanella benthica TaxID=43661 RepID=A0A330LV74_9GAMM|nr:hypothetical protein [Shewanella benthica]SQH74149.1 protein of unknown function [Shewanella benthica]